MQPVTKAQHQIWKVAICGLLCTVLNKLVGYYAINLALAKLLDLVAPRESTNPKIV
jgi:hypothetical protein